MNQEMLREDLLASFQELQRQFDSSLEEAKELDNQFTKGYKQFHSNLSGLLADSRAQVPKNSPLNQTITTFISGLAAQDADWKARLENQNKGLSFRKNFEDSLLVYVYGKVKSGKSSLGNYMAWGHTDPTREQHQCGGAKLQYRSYENSNAENGDGENEAEKQEKFRVDATEATSSIQSFRLPGLTWVDSPGLHSVRMQNGELAKEHADHADLILYTMKSDAPGRASDLKEIVELSGKEKNLMLLLTGSDKKILDWDDEADEEIERVVMKPQQDRQLQRDYVRKELQEANIDVKNVAILSVSARYAELNADNPAAIKDSGMGQLFTTLHQISQQHGVRMKRAVPMTNFKNFLSLCITEVAQYHELTGKFTKDLHSIRQSLSKKTIPEIREAQFTMQAVIQTKFDELSASRDYEDNINASLKAAKTQWDKQLNMLISQALENILADVMANFKSTVTATWNSSSLSLPHFSIEKTIQQIPDGYTKGTRNRNSGLGGLIGAGVGFLIAGPAGAAAGSIIGSGIGAAAGDGSRQNTRDIEIAVGDNLNEVRTRTLSTYNEAIDKIISDEVQTQFESLLIDLENACATISDEIGNFEKVLGELRKNAEHKLISQVD